MAEQVHILVTGGGGQLGLELAAGEWPVNFVIHTPGRDTLDLTDPVSIRSTFSTQRFAAVINSGAWTGVDAAESAVAATFAANALGPAVLAELTRGEDIPLIQISTDYVFDGTALGPYVEGASVRPLGVYGASKLAGELAVLSGAPRSVVLRTAWVLSRHRNNFLKTMLRLAADRPKLRVVDDQRGCPTSAKDIASAVIAITTRMIADRDAPTGIYHFVNAGETTWAGLAREIMALSAQSGGPSCEIEPITTAEYPTPAARPANSVLSTSGLTRDFGLVPRPWQVAVAEIVAELHPERSPE